MTRPPKSYPDSDISNAGVDTSYIPPSESSQNQEPLWAGHPTRPIKLLIAQLVVKKRACLVGRLVGEVLLNGQYLRKDYDRLHTLVLRLARNYGCGTGVSENEYRPETPDLFYLQDMEGTASNVFNVETSGRFHYSLEVGPDIDRFDFTITQSDFDQMMSFSNDRKRYAEKVFDGFYHRITEIGEYGDRGKLPIEKLVDIVTQRRSISTGVGPGNPSDSGRADFNGTDPETRRAIIGWHLSRDIAESKRIERDGEKTWNRFCSKSEAEKVHKIACDKIEKGAQKYSVGTELVITPDPHRRQEAVDDSIPRQKLDADQKRFNSIKHQLVELKRGRGRSAGVVQGLRDWIGYRIDDDQEWDDLTALHFTDSGLPHLHIEILGLSSDEIPPQEQIAEYLDTKQNFGEQVNKQRIYSDINWDTPDCKRMWYYEHGSLVRPYIFEPIYQLMNVARGKVDPAVYPTIEDEYDPWKLGLLRGCGGFQIVTATTGIQPTVTESGWWSWYRTIKADRDFEREDREIRIESEMERGQGLYWEICRDRYRTKPPPTEQILSSP